MASASAPLKSASVSGVWRALSKRARSCAPSYDALWWCFAIFTRFLSSRSGRDADRHHSRKGISAGAACASALAQVFVRLDQLRKRAVGLLQAVHGERRGVLNRIREVPIGDARSRFRCFSCRFACHRAHIVHDFKSKKKIVPSTYRRLGDFSSICRRLMPFTWPLSCGIGGHNAYTGAAVARTRQSSRS